jgi:hypothetical protein
MSAATAPILKLRRLATAVVNPVTSAESALRKAAALPAVLPQVADKNATSAARGAILPVTAPRMVAAEATVAVVVVVVVINKAAVVVATADLVRPPATPAVASVT